MAQLYQILLIEKDESFAGLIRDQLNKLDINISVEAIQQKEQLSHQLKNHTPHLIISEYTRHGFTAIEDLNQLRSSHPNLPLILTVPMDGSEKKACDLMLQGVSDYVMRGNISRLGPAVKRELRTSEKWSQTRQQLEKSRDRYQNLVQSVNGIVWEADAETFKFHYVSPRSKDILGYEPSEWYEKKDFWKNHIHPEDRKKAITYCHYKSQRGEDHTFDYRMITAEDNVVWLRDYVTVIPKDGKTDRLRGFMIDITQEKKAERLLDQAQQMARIGAWEVNMTNKEIYWSPVTRQIHEVNADFEPDLESSINFYKEGENRAKIKKLLENAIENGKTSDVEVQLVTAKGKEQWVRVKAEPEMIDGECIRLYGSIQDIHERKSAQLNMQEAYEERQKIMDRITDAFFAVDEDWKVTYWNNKAEQMLHTPQNEIIGQNLWENFEEAKELDFYTQYHKAVENQITVHFKEYYPPEEKWFEVSAYPSEGGLSVFFRDITKQKERETQLKESLKEKETLLQEIHHRVKNNLAVVSGMMQLQAFEEEDNSLQQKLFDSVNRIRTMGTIHELLYQSRSFSKLNFHETIRKLVSEIISTFGPDFVLDTEFDLGHIHLNINQAIPTSLIINEVVTNALKHAFGVNGKGVLSISLSEENNTVSLQINDNGKGLPQDFQELQSGESLGLKLIDTLSKQLEAEYTYQSMDNGGTQFSLAFEKADVKGIGNAKLR